MRGLCVGADIIIFIFGSFQNFVLDPSLAYGSKEEPSYLLQKVIEANDQAADEEDIPKEFQSATNQKNPGAKFGRKSGHMSEYSGGDSRHYRERAGASKKKLESQHPLFKAFR